MPISFLRNRRLLSSSLLLSALCLPACSGPADDSEELPAPGSEVATLTSGAFEPRSADALDLYAAYSSGDYALPGANASDAERKTYCQVASAFALAALSANQNVSEANAVLRGLATSTYFPNDNSYDPEFGCFWGMLYLVRIYASPTTSQRLEASTKASLEQMLWQFVFHRSTIAEATNTDSWQVHMSENMDAMKKSALLVATQALRATRGDNATLEDGATLVQHQNSWRSYWKLYFLARAREGINLEIASAYSKYTLASYYNVYEFTPSSVLKSQARRFLDLYWADYAQDFLPATGVRGGASTRVYKDAAERTANKATLRDWTYIYGWHDFPHTAERPTLIAATSAYRIPEIIGAMASDTNKAPYQYISRRPGLVRPGAEDELLCIDRYIIGKPETTPLCETYDVGFDAGNSYVRRYSYITQDYVLGALKFDPARDYTTLTDQNRVMGINFAANPDWRILIHGNGTDADGAVGLTEIVGDAAVNAMVVARDVNAEYSDGTRIYISLGDLWTNLVYDGGWLFTQAGGAYAGIRIATGGTGPTDRYVIHSVDEGKFLDLKDKWSPVVIQVGQAANYSSFAAFRSSVKANAYSYSNGTLSYTSENNDVFSISRASTSMPTVNGGGSTNPAKTYNSPYIVGFHGENVVTVNYSNYAPLTLDFSY